MAVLSISALIECDECAVHFASDMDAARTVPTGWSLWDAAVDTVRGGYVNGTSVFDGSCSVQDGRMLCIECTRKADAESDEDGEEDEALECPLCEGRGTLDADDMGLGEEPDCWNCGGEGFL